MPITAFYAALLVPLFILLCARVIGMRRSSQITVGHRDNADLLRRMRVQANFAEYTPMALILLGLAESMGTDVRILHAAGTAFLLSRVLHAYGFSQADEKLGWRISAMVLTINVLAVLAALCLWGALNRLLAA